MEVYAAAKGTEPALHVGTDLEGSLKEMDK